MTNGSSVVIFDLGGVLYDFRGTRLIERTSRRTRRWRSEEVQAHWPELAGGFETGAVSDMAFAESVVRHYQLTLAPAEFLAEFRSAAVGFYEGALSLLAELGERHRVLSLSNINPVQWPKVLADLGECDPFHAHHPSHLSGLRKPDLRVFQAVARLLSTGSTIHFFDDRWENVNAARSCGWHAERVRGVAQARAACQRAGLLG
ncbi:MAG TPA: HAD family hydrolase [Polyangiaceae bacterium]|nr:HAD family hydrolase [Polyangiaceae bacterium]